jgi:methyl-coenzyme M reductase gamma subunit
MARVRKRRKGRKVKRYKAQLYPGPDEVSERRRFVMDASRRLKKFRSIPDDNLVMLLGHRHPGELYLSIHPPLDELIEKYDPIKNIVEPTPGARAGDRIRFILFTDSVYYPPMAPWLRARTYLNRFRGIDTVVYSSRQLLEMRERDLEAVAKELIESNLFDPGRVAIRGLTAHGHSLRLDEDGLIFDARRRYKFDKDLGEVVYIKNAQAEILDMPIPIGRPLSEREARGQDVTYRWDVAPYKSRTEIMSVIARYGTARILGGYNPELLNEIDPLYCEPYETLDKMMDLGKSKTEGGE